ncbi:hypothetical protein QEG73_00040 [Chitinophagaceae bacterium 26-R-25]|nr:hypothetical protein [Chitinophagaceae bacterium 26-R-25]
MTHQKHPSSSFPEFETLNSLKDENPCPTCGHPSSHNQPSTTSIFVYAIGKIEPRFPSRSLEKEFMQIVGRMETKGLTDQQTLHKVISLRENRYIARQLCWVFTVEGMETYLLSPRDPLDLDLLIESVRPEQSALDIDVVIGTRGPVAPPEICNGLAIPVVIFNQLYSFDQHSLVNSIPKSKDGDPAIFSRAANELIHRVIQLADNNGASNANRALNYLIVRYPAVYARITAAYSENNSLTSVNVFPSGLSNGGRVIVDVVFSFTNRTTDVVEKFFVRVDVTDEFPFLVTKLSPFFSRSVD